MALVRRGRNQTHCGRDAHPPVRADAKLPCRGGALSYGFLRRLLPRFNQGDQTVDHLIARQRVGFQQDRIVRRSERAHRTRAIGLVTAGL